MLNTKIYTTKLSDAKDYARLCGVKGIQEEGNAIGYAFTQSSKNDGCIVAFQKGSGIDKGRFCGITYKEISRADLKKLVLE